MVPNLRVRLYSVSPERTRAVGELVEWREGGWSFLALQEWSEPLPGLVRSVAADRYPPSWERRSCGRDFIVIAPLGAGHRQAVIRPYRRGGAVGKVVRSTYWGWRPRCFAEIRCLVELSQRDIPVAPPVGAAVRWRPAWFYEAWLVTQYVEGSSSLWEWLQRCPPAQERRQVIDDLGRVLANFHRTGARHPDLNLHNVLVQSRGQELRVWLVDLDRVALARTPTNPQPSLARLWRSARKLDPQQRYWTRADQQALEDAVEVRFAGR
ncbi:MAG: hypothetical protein N3C12_07055 [Candidatus Binatia bacterium]|nr:hypothetical protein [Candidatus Binatia bacterium]